MSDAKEIDKIANGIFSFLKDRKQLFLLEKVALKLYKRAEQMHQATIITPVSLGPKDRKKAEKLAIRLTHNQASTFKYLTDKKLIDGMMIVFADKVWDFTMSGRLDSFKKGATV